MTKGEAKVRLMEEKKMKKKKEEEDEERMYDCRKADWTRERAIIRIRHQKELQDCEKAQNVHSLTTRSRNRFVMELHYLRIAQNDEEFTARNRFWFPTQEEEEEEEQEVGEEEREEYTVTFGLGPLEMVLLNTRPITVDSVNSPSHASLHVEVKSQIIKVGDTDVSDGTLQDFCEVLKTLPRPVTLTFLRPSSSSATSSDHILEMDDDEEGEEEEEVGEEEDERKRSGGGGSRGGEKRKKKDDKNGGEENKKPKMH